jgi:hypothetical protein
MRSSSCCSDSWFGTLAAMYFAAAAVSLSNVFWVPGFFVA